MKKLLILILLVSFTAFSQTFEVVNKGYYYGQVGTVKLPNRTTDLKALTDVQEYLEANNLENGQVVRPPLEVSRKKTVTTPPQVIRDTVLVHIPIIVKDTVYVGSGGSEMSIGNQWMGEPIKEVKVYGDIISDKYGSSNATTSDKAFDGDINTYSSRHAQSLGWIGQDYGEAINVSRFRFLPQQNASSAVKMNGALIQYSDNGTNWTTIHEISGITDTNYMDWIDVVFPAVSARYFRIYSTQSYSYCRVAELEIYNL